MAATTHAIDTIQAQQRKTMQRYSVGLDVYTGTSNPECFPTHKATAQDFLSRLHKNGMLEKRTSRQWYDPKIDRFLQDRFVQGKCPNPKCDNEKAYSDECDKCGLKFDPTELLNRWIIPLENRVDYLSLSNGRKIQVPFEQLIIFSTNLEPHDLADDAFLRRIPFKVEIGNPSTQEFHLLFQIFAKKHKLECPPQMVDYLIREHYHKNGRPLRRCHARDLLEQVIYYCNYNELPLEITEEYLDHAVQNYFTALKGD